MSPWTSCLLHCTKRASLRHHWGSLPVCSQLMNVNNAVPHCVKFVIFHFFTENLSLYFVFNISGQVLWECLVKNHTTVGLMCDPEWKNLTCPSCMCHTHKKMQVCIWHNVLCVDVCLLEYEEKGSIATALCVAPRS